MRWIWFVTGWLAVAVGGIGVVVPGLPTTVFFIIAAWCFGRSSPRFERWVLGLPRIGPIVRGHRAGLGMPRRAKTFAVSMIVVFAGGSALAAGHPALSLAIVTAGVVGVWYVASRVPTRERVLAAAGGEPAGGAPTG